MHLFDNLIAYIIMIRTTQYKKYFKKLKINVCNVLWLASDKII